MSHNRITDRLGIKLRRCIDEDRDVLYKIFVSTREMEISFMDASKEDIDLFLKTQFYAQDKYYHDTFLNADFEIIEYNDETAGRLYTENRGDHLGLIDIAILPEYRNKGIGSIIMKDLQEKAGNVNLPIRIYVEKNNPAMTYYNRHGFKTIDDLGIHYYMEWTPNENK